MSRDAHSKHKVEVLAHCLRGRPTDPVAKHPSGWWVGDLRLVASPMRYKVQRWEYDKYKRDQTWRDTRWRFPRTRRTFVEWEYDCAVAMFQRRCWELWMVNEGKAWPSQDGRTTPLRLLTTPHLRNIIAKIERDGNWRERFMPALKAEIDRRYSYTV